MSGWFYIKSGIVEDQIVGPLKDNEIGELTYAGELSLKTKVIHPQHTKNQWRELRHVPVLCQSASFARFQSGAGRRRRSYQRLAKRFAGTYVSGGLFTRPSVRMRYGETRAVLREANGHGNFDGKCTQLQIEWPDDRLVCEILPLTADAGPATRGLTEHTTANPSFNRRYLVCGNSDRDVQQLLSDGVRWQIDRLSAMNEHSELYLQFRRGNILIQNSQLIRHFDELAEFIERGLELYDQVMLTRAVGIEFVAADEAQTLEDVICKVCGESIQHDLVYCRRCKTPHHGKCWRYIGACSVYGCQEKAYLHPQTASRSTESEATPGSTKPR